ncbi:hypothetical protein ACFE33_09560 [Falsihalocynthiibacter sp. SS001]|uniref:hypothetical protein n=1 Tax=Falsihalocynthiibacter sp. SS001 TaxID=3349698 RepID=UPI0036D3D580
MALYIDKSDKFAFEKPAGVTCRNLTGDDRCKIHNTLEEQGCSGCIDYTCDGAGQRVVQDLYGGISWQKRPETLAPMSEDFAKMRRIHDLLTLLAAARKLRLSDPIVAELDGYIQRLLPQEDWSRETFDAFDEIAIKSEVTSFLQRLREHLPPPASKLS